MLVQYAPRTVKGGETEGISKGKKMDWLKVWGSFADNKARRKIGEWEKRHGLVTVTQRLEVGEGGTKKDRSKRTQEVHVDAWIELKSGVWFFF